MRAILVAGRQAHNGTYYVHVGDLNWWLFYLNQDQERQRTIYLWEGPCVSDELAGWSLLSPRFRAFDVFVHPRERGSEQAGRMFAWTEERMREVVREAGGSSLCTVWVLQDDAWLTVFLERRGFVRSDYHLYMVRPLDGPVPAPLLPPGYSLRHVAGAHEAGARAAVAHAAFQSGLTPARHERRMRQFMSSPVYTPELDLVVVAPGGRFAAFALCWLDGVNRVGLFEPVGTHPDFWRKGLGKAVLQEGLRRMQAQGMTTAMVCVEHDNPAAQELYARVGFGVVNRIYTYVREV
jgi:mycothiol synthase